MTGTAGRHPNRNVERELRHLRAMGIDIHRPLTLRILNDALDPAQDVGRLPFIGTRGNVNNLVPTKAIVLNVKSRLGELKRGSEGEKRGHLRPRCGRGLGSNGACLSRFRAGNQTLGPASPGILPRRWGRQWSQLPAVSHCPEADPRLGSDRPDRPSGDPCPHRPLPRRRRSGTVVD